MKMKHGIWVLAAVFSSATGADEVAIGFDVAGNSESEQQNCEGIIECVAEDLVSWILGNDTEDTGEAQ